MGATTAAGPATARRGLHRGLQIGLRGRITLAVALVGLLLSIVLSATTLTVAQNTLLSTREETLKLQASANAKTIAGSLGISEASDLQTLLSSLPSGGVPSLVLSSGADPINVSVDARLGVDVLPAALIDQVVNERRSGIMRFEADGDPLVAVGIAVPDTDASYFEVNQLEDITTALRRVSITLLIATVIATLIAMGLGFWASRYALRPLGRIGQAAEAVAHGQLDTRIDYEDYATDIDLAPLVANFNDMVSALQDRIDRDARFASDVSHELRSPLTTLNASIDVLLNSRDSLPERSQQALDLLSMDMERFTQLVEDLLEISRFDAGAVRLEVDDVALVPTVEAAIRAASGGTVPVEADPELTDLVISCDKRRLMRILVNFVDNARKYADGATGVYIERHEPGDLLDVTEAATPTVRIGVEDGGPGVPEAERERIFDRFNRGDQGGSRGADMGVGLGLALAAEHARLQGGTVWVEDRHDGGQGARFVVELPLLDESSDREPGSMADLAEVSREEADMLAVTGELPAIVIDTPREPR